MGNDWLNGLTTPDLRRLGEALAMGFISPRCDAALLRYHRLPAEWATSLEVLRAGGWRAETLAQATTWMLREREKAERSRVHLVSTQPGIADDGFIDTAVVLRQLFEQAEHDVLVAGYRVTSRDVLEHLRRKHAKRLDIRLYCDLDPGIDVHGKRRPARLPVEGYPLRWWAEFLDEIWPQAMDPPAGYYCPVNLEPGGYGWNLMHVKTVVVDRERWFVTSANLSFSGQFRNMELGVVLDDPSTAKRVVGHFEKLVADGVFVRLGEDAERCMTCGGAAPRDSEGGEPCGTQGHDRRQSRGDSADPA